MINSDILNCYLTHRKLIEENKHIYEFDSIRFEPLCGDMSYKCFFRVTFHKKSFILIVIPTEGSASIEIFNEENQLSINPAEAFIETAIELANHIDHVSPVYEHNLKEGLILVSDHGDYLFEDYVNKNQSNKKSIKDFYQDVFKWLKNFQALPQKLPKNFFALNRTLESEALYLELDEYVQYGLIQYEQNSLKKNESLKQYSELCHRLEKQYKTLIHRDFQSKNIMLTENDFWIIDYQDLCYGPYTYDYASIIFDPYLNLPLDFQNELIQLSWEMNFYERISYEQYKEDIILCAKQRLLKAAGRYAKHLVLKDKDTHMKYYQPAVDKSTELDKYLL